MDEPRIDPKTQFSKKLARWTAVFWFFYMTWLSVIMMLEPNAALYTVYMGILSTLVMLLNVWAYTKNSVYEKGTMALLDKMKLEMRLDGKPMRFGDAGNGTAAAQEEPEEETDEMLEDEEFEKEPEEDFEEDFDEEEPDDESMEDEDEMERRSEG